MRPATAIAFLTALSLASPAAAQPRQPTRQEAPAPGQPAVLPPELHGTVDARESREQFERLLEQYPPSLPRVLRLDPSLLNNSGYLQPYPGVATFVAQHPEIAHNPDYFLASYDRGNYFREDPKDRAFNMWRQAMEGFTMLTVFALIAGALAWLIKTVIEHRRWTRLSKIQADVHTKLLDRFTAAVAHA